MKLLAVRTGRVGQLNAVAGRVDRGRDAGRLRVDRGDDLAQRFGARQIDVDVTLLRFVMSMSPSVPSPARP